MDQGELSSADLAIVGAGAAGLATAIFAARKNPALRICLLDGAQKIGAKILVSGGGRCNVTNARVTPDDFFGGSRNTIRRVLNAFAVEQTVAFFEEIGVPLHVEEYGKYFPDSEQARTVLDALLKEAERRHVRVLPNHRVRRVDHQNDVFTVFFDSSQGTASSGESIPDDEKQNAIRARKLVLATGGKSLPKTGSDGAGYELAQRLGHSLVPTTPALAPLILGGDFHTPLSGISQDVELRMRHGDPSHATGLNIRGQTVRLRGPMLWTHFGVSGPAAMNASRVWHRALLEQKPAGVSVNFLPDETRESADQRWTDLATSHPKVLLSTALAGMIPARVAETVLRRLGIGERIPLAHLSREQRRLLVQGLLEWPLPVRDSRGYLFAEATAGGVPLTEIDPNTMASRVCPGLFLTGEILDVDGRIGGFNFQWAWSSAYVAAGGIARRSPL